MKHAEGADSPMRIGEEPKFQTVPRPAAVGSDAECTQAAEAAHGRCREDDEHEFNHSSERFRAPFANITLRPQLTRRSTAMKQANSSPNTHPHHWYDPLVEAERKTVDFIAKDIDLTLKHADQLDRKVRRASRRHPLAFISAETAFFTFGLLFLLVAQLRYAGANI
jgi:hypothetical protein